MRRLFWMGVGAAAAVVVAQRARQAVRSLPDAVVHQVEDATGRASSALRDAVAEFRTARAAREVELVDALLVEPEGGTERRPRTRPGTDAALRVGPHRAAHPADDDPGFDPAWDDGDL